MAPPSHCATARTHFHAVLLDAVLRIDADGVASNANRGNTASIRIARGIVSLLGAEVAGARLAGQMAGNRFEEICRHFLESTFGRLVLRTAITPPVWRGAWSSCCLLFGTMWSTWNV